VFDTLALPQAISANDNARVASTTSDDAPHSLLKADTQALVDQIEHDFDAEHRETDSPDPEMATIEGFSGKHHEWVTVRDNKADLEGPPRNVRTVMHVLLEADGFV